MQKGDQDRIPPLRVHPLELRRRGFPAQLGQPFHPVGVEPARGPRCRPAPPAETRPSVSVSTSCVRRVGRGFAAEPIEDGTAGLRDRAGGGHRARRAASAVNERGQPAQRLRRAPAGVPWQPAVPGA